jgi:hypothetical protein
MPHKIENLLQDAGRSREVFIGWVCALISGTFAAILVWLLYLVAWRNPREYGVNDLYRISTLMIFGALLTIAIGFSVIAFRLIRRTRRQSGLMSPAFLRVWGSFFVLGGAAVLIDGIVKKRWIEVPHYWAVLTTSVSMSCAAFVLARRLERGEVSDNSTSEPGGPANGSQPIRSETNRTSSTAGSRH